MIGYLIFYGAMFLMVYTGAGYTTGMFVENNDPSPDRLDDAIFRAICVLWPYFALRGLFRKAKNGLDWTVKNKILDVRGAFKVGK